MNFIAWATGNAIGPQVFLWWDGPQYLIAFATHLGCYSLLIINLVVLRWYLTKQNARKDAVAGGEVRLSTMHAFEDLTDWENGDFRYVI